VIFHDDLAWLRSGFCPENMAVVKHMAMNLLRSPKHRKASSAGENSPASTPITAKLSSANRWH
jgi:hypothetical protein